MRRAWVEISLTHPLKLNGIGITLSLSESRLKHEDERGLVNMFASWSSLEILMDREFSVTMPLMKWKSISEDKYVAPILSHLGL
jgi:hypothetical protein